MTASLPDRLRKAAERLWEDAWYAADVAEGKSDRYGPPATEAEAIERLLADVLGSES